MEEVGVLGPAEEVHDYGLVALEVETTAQLHLKIVKLSRQSVPLSCPLLLEFQLVQQSVIPADTREVILCEVDYRCVADVEWRHALALSLLIYLVNAPLEPPSCVVILLRYLSWLHCLDLILDG